MSAVAATADAGVVLPGAKPVVVAQGLTKVFKDFWMRDRVRAVNDLSFHIEPREIFGLLGPNGSGKSTTIKMMLGLLRPTRGRLAIFGRAPSDVAVKERIGFLPEESFFHQYLNARETLDYYGRMFKMHGRTRTKRVDELLDMVGLTHAQFRPMREYSKGMQRRVGLAQALINDPELLILDEPTTGLDPLGTRQVKDLILELGRRGKTVVLSSHLLADVEDVVDRMSILYGGVKRDEGTTDELLTSSDKTTIETDALDEETIAEIDRVIRERTGGTKSLLRVSHPRMKLEQKFLDIVERARSESVSTSGASGEGATASFLRADGTADQGGNAGDELIDRLTRAVATPEPAAAPEAEASAVDEPDVLGDLLKSDTVPVDTDPAVGRGLADRPSGGPTAPQPAPQEDVDMDVIGSLLDDASDSGDDDDGRAGGKP
ncbi:MAG: ABC transporter ATP-binding protein [Planctomycetota bacterium]